MAISHHGNDDWLASYDAEEAPLVRGKHDPRDVYGLYGAIKSGAAPLLVVDAISNYEIGQALFPGCSVVTWLADSITKVRWEALEARENLHAILMPSNDDESRHLMDMVAGELGRSGYSIEVIDVSHMPDGWTLADSTDWTVADARLFYEEHVRDFITDVLPTPVRAPQRQQTVDEPDDGMGEEIIPASMPTELISATHKLLDDAKRDDTTKRVSIQGWQDLGLDVGTGGKPTGNVSNVSLIMASHYQDMVWYDSFLGRIRTRTADRNDTRDWTDPDDIRLTIEMQRAYQMTKVTRDIVHQAVVEHAYRNVKNELVEWLNSLAPWDGIERCEMFFIDCAGAKDSEYARAVGRNFWTGMAARALKPGCKLDTMVILEGKQGKSKSTLLEVIGGRWYAIMAAAPDSNDFAITLAGKLVIEVAELQSFSKADENSVKRTLRTASDRYRAPYGRHAEDHPRSSILAGTTNRDDYNMDSTGFRHGWPIACGDIRIDLVRENREQLFAEALSRYRAGATWWEMPGKETERQQMHRYVGDPWDAKVEHIVSLHTSVTIPYIMQELHLSNQEQNRASQMRIAGILKMSGWEKVTEYEKGEGAVRRWKREAKGT